MSRKQYPLVINLSCYPDGIRGCAGVNEISPDFTAFHPGYVTRQRKMRRYEIIHFGHAVHACRLRRLLCAKPLATCRSTGGNSVMVKAAHTHRNIRVDRLRSGVCRAGRYVDRVHRRRWICLAEQIAGFLRP
jgi:hypothetical protein